MATSGTSAFSLPFDELLEQASLRVGGEATLGLEARTVRRALNLLFADMENRGVLLHTVEQATAVLVSGVATVTAPSSTVDILDMVSRVYSGVSSNVSVSASTPYTDFPMKRLSFDEFLEIPRKQQVGQRPYWYYVARNTAGPVITVWPTPTGANAATLVYWRVRFIQSASKLADDPDFPRRFYPALVAGLAYYLAMQRGLNFPMDRIQLMKAEFEEQLGHAMGEDRERASFRAVPKTYRN